MKKDPNKKIQRVGAGDGLFPKLDFDLDACNDEILEDFYGNDEPFLDPETINAIKRYFDIQEHPEKYSEEELKEFFKKQDEKAKVFFDKLYDEAERMYPSK